ncbi:proline-rich receptor-like protein kinase PERK1 [Ziziphus jujuba]|uniref:non-specific serine/threonine protein kinase n=1 Tax=Ziziphus jujuba TaxID=326968 RepID=A0A6P4AHI7_ZIZJJ|nr:proline-rich receptor-like protein kinase PERK1 [Ziziphus jujuba]
MSSSSPLMSSSSLGPTISPAITPPRITRLPSSPPPPLAAATPPPLPPPALSPATSTKDHSLPPAVSPPSPPVTTPASPLTSPSPAAASPPLPSPTVATPPPSSPELPTPPPVVSPPPTSSTTTPLSPRPPIPTPPLPSTASPPLPAPPLSSRASPPPHATPKPTPPSPPKPSTTPSPHPASSPLLPPKSTISPAITSPSPPPPHKSTISPPPVSVTTPLSPTSSPATISPPPTVATPLLSPPSPTTSSSLPSSSSNGSLPKALDIQKPQPNPSRGLIFGCIIGGVVLLLLLVLVLVLLCLCRRRKRKKLEFVERYTKPTSLGPKDNLDAVPPQNVHHSVIDVGSGSTSSGCEVPNPPQANGGGVALGSTRGTFTYDQLVVATNGFSEANLVGQGGFGYVHKGVLPGGKEVAVKRLMSGSRQGEREFHAEVDTISRIHHKHLVSLVGYCITGSERLLVYEFVPNNNLEFHLHGNDQHVMDWETRLKIAVGSAKGLAYLHEDCNPTIIHRDIKAANILLDFGFEAKVSDFGLAKHFSDANTHISHISTQVVGTFGYLAPEYALSGKVTEKSDVYSYGVVLLELITGRPPIQTTDSVRNESLVEWARPLLNVAMNEGDFDGLVDPKLHQNYNADEMNRMVACAAACVRHSAWLRPRMSQIVHALEGHASPTDLQQRSSTLYSSSASSVYNAQHMKMLREQVYGISGYSDSTSEYGLNPSVSSSEGPANNLTKNTATNT